MPILSDRPNYFKKLKSYLPFIKKGIYAILFIIIIGFLIPQNFIIPVENATKDNWDSETFWYFPWGQSIVHKGVDIFAEEGRNVLAATGGIVVSVGKTGNGGNIIYVLGSKWRVHYYAHLQVVETSLLSFVSMGQVIGKVGKTGNAITTPSHLHYSIETYIPYPWRWDSDIMGWKKMFYLNPTDYLNECWHLKKQNERIDLYKEFN
jgi:peptidoglycan LD-endopeptidase LytH